MPAWRRRSDRFYVAYAAGDRWLKLDVVMELAVGPGFELRGSAGPELAALAAPDCAARRLGARSTRSPAPRSPAERLLDAARRARG